MDLTVAFQGVPGSHSEQAVRQHFGDEVTLLARPRFADLFDVLEESLAQHAVLPVENTYAGGVLSAYDLLLENNLHIQGEVILRAYDLLLENNLHIQGEVILRVHHALLARPGVKLDDLRYVRSHPQALEQCEQFLRRYGLEGVPHFNTAGSARDLTREAWQATGVIASARAAELYGLEVLAPNIEDSPHNYTRFFVVGATQPVQQDQHRLRHPPRTSSPL